MAGQGSVKVNGTDCHGNDIDARTSSLYEDNAGRLSACAFRVMSYSPLPWYVTPEAPSHVLGARPQGRAPKRLSDLSLKLLAVTARSVTQVTVT